MKIIDAPNAPKAIGPYSQGINFNNLVFTSGQIPIDPITNNLIKGDFKKEVIQVLKNLDIILLDGGSSLKDIIKLSVFLVDLAKFSELNKVFKLYFKDNLPARSVVEVSALPLGANVKIEAIGGINR